MNSPKSEEMKKDIQTAGRLEQLCRQSGWKDIEEYLSGEYQNALNELVTGNQNGSDSGLTLARVKMQVITGLVKWIKDSESFGKEQLKKYNKLFKAEE